MSNPQPPAPGEPPPPEDGAAEPRRGRGKAKPIAALAGLALVVVAVVFGLSWFDKSPASAEVGDCVKINKTGSTKADVDKVDCAEPGAVFAVGKKLDSDTARCPGSSYLKYTSSGRGSSFSLCLVLNAGKGDCFDDAESTA